MIEHHCNHKKYQRDCYSCWTKRLPEIKYPTGKDVLDFVKSIGLQDIHMKILWKLYREELLEEMRLKGVYTHCEKIK